MTSIPWPIEKQRLAAGMHVASVRGSVLQAIRKFFVQRDFTEFETPVRLPAPAPETHIDAEPAGNQYLRTSPELQMKRLLAAGYSRIFQIGPCFRRGELGRLHNPEYTMLEWYRANALYSDVLVDAKALISYVATEVLGTTRLTYQSAGIELMPVWEYLTVSDAFSQTAGWDPVAAFDADRFYADLVSVVEPALPLGTPVVLADYPIEAGALARCKPADPRVAERWELYIGGMELANAFSELTDPDEQRARFMKSNDERRLAGKETYPIDETFLAALKDMPPSAGVALGIDRLVMLLCDLASLDDVLLFRARTG